MTRLSISPHIWFALVGVELGQRLVEHLVDLGDADAGVGGTAGRPDDPRVDDLGQEAEAIRPVGSPAVECQAQLVLHHVRRQAGVLGEVVALRVRLQGELDADPTSACWNASAVAFSFGRSAR